MGCLSAIIRKVGGTTARILRTDGMACSVIRYGDLSGMGFSRYSTPSAVVAKASGMTARVGLVCTTNIDIRPGILWASDGRLITLEGGFLIPNGR